MDLLVKIVVFIFLFDITIGVRQLVEKDLGLAGDAGQAGIANIRRKRGLAKVARKLIMRSKIFWTLQQAKRILLRDAKAEGSFLIQYGYYSKSGGKLRAYSDWTEMNPGDVKNLFASSKGGRIGQYTLTYTVEHNPLASCSSGSLCPTITLWKDISPRHKIRKVTVHYTEPSDPL